MTPLALVCASCSFRAAAGPGRWPSWSATDPRVELTVGINGYDDGASTGEVRRFLGDALGPSDFRKNASRLARLRRDVSRPRSSISSIAACRTAPPRPISQPGRRARRRSAPARTCRRSIRRRARPSRRGCDASTRSSRAGRPINFQRRERRQLRVCRRLPRVRSPFQRGGRRLLRAGRPAAGLIENVTDGANAFLVALDDDDRLLGSEEEIVDAKRHNRVKEIFLIDAAVRRGASAPG